MSRGSAKPLVSLAPLERERFGFECARASGVTAERLGEVLDFCRRERVRLLTARCRIEDVAAAHAIEEAGGRVMDTLIYWRHDLAAPARAERPAAGVRLARAGDEAAVERAAREAFAGYLGHYHADPRLPREQCDAAYADWARRACVASSPDSPLFLGEHEGSPAAFAALRRASEGGADGDGEGVLYGVAPRARGRGLYLALMFASLDWCRERGARRMIISTQLVNWVPQQVWSRLGFEPYEAHYTYHLWLEPR